MTATDTAAESRDTLDDNVRLVRRFVQEVFAEGRKESVDALVADDFASHTWPARGDGKAALKEAIDRVGAALSDAGFEVHDTIAQADLVAVRLTASATQTGPFMNLPPSGKRYTIDEIHIFRVRDGRVREHWHQYDQLGLMKQLGAMPGGPRSAAAADRSEGAGSAPERRNG